MEFVLEILPNNRLLAVLFSLFLNVMISIAGFVPSAFLTAANILFFGFKIGLIISITGEAIGAIISFYLYRRGIEALKGKYGNKGNNRFLEKLKETSGMEAVYLVFIMRIFPFVPSGLVTLAASMSRMCLVHFAFASTFGKIPALAIEAYSVHAVINLETRFQLAAAVAGLGLAGIYMIWKMRKRLDQ
ncbi:VTT domain-containing protein [Bacillus sp. FJAT-27251]|uniref:TVP38/TMEM64 family protein n=1 Tax=Bacillus sp. FJAT-27251 TaxID=1684142 RepID=UPI0006A786E6|nr:VTT domain-containing protein [Bacillus sp. FJAT-27251]